jgi:hypothetical protein
LPYLFITLLKGKTDGFGVVGSIVTRVALLFIGARVLSAHKTKQGPFGDPAKTTRKN